MNTYKFFYLGFDIFTRYISIKSIFIAYPKEEFEKKNHFWLKQICKVSFIPKTFFSHLTFQIFLGLSFEMCISRLFKTNDFYFTFRYAMSCRLRRQGNREKLESQVKFIESLMKLSG